MTTTLPDREEIMAMLERRRAFLGSSDMPKIAGLHPYDDPMDVYLSKVRPPSEEEAENIHILRGRLLEPVFADLYEDQTGNRIRNISQRVHPDYEWAGANPDRQLLSSDDRDTAAVEIKSPTERTFRRVLDEGLFDSWIVQAQWQMFVCDYASADFVAGNLESDRGPLIYFTLERNDGLIEQLWELGNRFWQEHVAVNVPPDPDDWKPRRVEVPPHDGERKVVDTPRARKRVHLLMRAYNRKKHYEDLYERAKKELVQPIMEEREATKIVVPGQGKVNWGWRSGRTYFDDDRLREYGALDPDKAREELEQLLKAAGFDNAEKREAAIGRFLQETELDLSLFESESDAYRAFRPYPQDELADPEAEPEVESDE